MLEAITRTKAWKKFAAHWLGGFTFRVFGYPSFPMEDYFKIIDRLDRGELYAFVSSDYQTLASRVIRYVTGKGSRFSHGGILMPGSDRTTTIIHMLGDGLRVENPLCLLRECDYFAVIRLPLSDAAKQEAVRRIAELIEKRAEIVYDFEQDLDNEDNKLYCSELFHDVFFDLVAGPGLDPEMVMGRKVYAPDQIINAGIVIYSNHNEVPEKCDT